MPLNRSIAYAGRMLLVLAALLTIGSAPAGTTPAPQFPDIGTPAETTTGDPVTSGNPLDAGFPTASSPDFSGCEVQPPAAVNAAFEQAVMELVNAERAAQGLPPLKRIPQLDQAARYHTADMVQDNYFQHDSYDRVNNQLQYACKWSDRVQKYYPGWSNLGENIAAGYSSPADVMQGWMNSSGHRANILSQSFSEIGIGYAGGNYWAQDFGRRGDSSPLIINNEADDTDNPAVSVYVYGSWSEIRLRNDSEAWGVWQPFKNQLGWQLPSTAGTHTVSAELRSGSKTAATSDTIILTTGAPAQPALGSLPDTVHFVYSISDGRLLPAQATLIPANTTTQQPLAWAAAIQGGPFTLSPSQGTTPASLTVTPSGFNTKTPNTYTGVLTVTITNPSGVSGSPHQTTLVLEVINRPVGEIFLPLLSTFTNR